MLQMSMIDSPNNMITVHCTSMLTLAICVCVQGVVLPPVSRGVEPHVLPVRVRQQQQLQSPD